MKKAVSYVEPFQTSIMSFFKKKIILVFLGGIQWKYWLKKESHLLTRDVFNPLMPGGKKKVTQT